MIHALLIFVLAALCVAFMMLKWLKSFHKSATTELIEKFYTPQNISFAA